MGFAPASAIAVSHKPLLSVLTPYEHAQESLSATGEAHLHRRAKGCHREVKLEKFSVAVRAQRSHWVPDEREVAASTARGEVAGAS
eukprot:5850023-Pleurochrysis_carterae.AAC.2